MYWSRCSCLPVVLVYGCIGFVTTLFVYCKPDKMIILLLLRCWYIVTRFNTTTAGRTSLMRWTQNGRRKEESCYERERFRSGSVLGLFFVDHFHHSVALKWFLPPLPSLPPVHTSISNTHLSYMSRIVFVKKEEKKTKRCFVQNCIFALLGTDVWYVFVFMTVKNCWSTGEVKQLCGVSVFCI